MDLTAKKPGCCLGCGEEVREVREYFEDGPLVGMPRRCGPYTEHGVQAEFLMSDGSEADITFCLDCANQIMPEDYQPIWEACLDLTDKVLSGRHANERKARLAESTKLWPVALLRCRREDPALREMVVDRRWRKSGQL